MSLLLHKTVNIFPLPPGIGAYINRIHILTVQKPAYNLKLFSGGGNDFILKFCGNKGNRLQRPSFIFFIIDLRITHGHQMPHAPGNDGVFGFHISVAVSRIYLKRFGKLSCHAWFFSYIQTFPHYIASIPNSLIPLLRPASFRSLSSKR